MSFDLSKVEPKGGSTPIPTFNRETTMPRQSTDRPELEVNQKVIRPDTSSAEQLAKLLGVAVDVASAAFQQDQERRDNRDAAQAAIDFSEGNQDPQKFAKSRAYWAAWQLQGAKKVAVDIGAEAAQKVSERLNDSDHPATPEDIDQTIEAVFQNHTMGPDGKPLDFGTVEAKTTLANAMTEVRANLIPQAMQAIKKQTDTRLLTTIASNGILEYRRGAPIGALLANDPLAPLPDQGTVTIKATPGAPSVTGGKAVEPFHGFDAAKPTSVMGAPRQGGSRHNGEDYAIPTGTPLVAPMAGKVIASFSNARGGNQIRVQMADGAIVGYAHLSDRKVAVGDAVTAGQVVGLSGATGDATGPHVHMTVEVRGKKVSPKRYFEGAVAPSALASAPSPTPTENNNIALATTASQDQPAEHLPPVNFEEQFMSHVPPGIDKKEAKTFFLQSVINEANRTGDVGILAGLEDSMRPDGTPSFSPQEVAVIQKAREEIADKTTADAEKARRLLWQQNGDALLTAMVSNNPPSDDAIAVAAQKGLIDPSTAYTLISHNRAARKEEATQARQEQRMADAEADSQYDAFTAGEVARMSVGDFSGPSAKELFDAGKLGPPGKKALGRYNQLRAGERAGEQRNRENPLYGQYMGKLRMDYGGPQGQPFLAPQFSMNRQGQSQVNLYAMMTAYKLSVSKGMEPEEAYLEVVAKYGPPKDAAAARAQLIKELRNKRAAGR